MDLYELTDTVVRIAVQAGDLILEVYRSRQGKGSFDVEMKSDHTPVTIADRKANDLICRELSKLDPAIPIISEENREIPYEVRQNYTRFWLVDPLDGTKEFIDRNGEFTVNIALMEGHEPALGVVHVPEAGKTFFAIRDGGSFLSGDPNPLQCKTFSSSDAHLRFACSRSHLNEKTREFIYRFNDPVLIPRGSALKFLTIVTGEADIYPRLGGTMEWDTGAAQIILEEAGGSVLTYPWFKPMKYNKTSLTNSSFVAHGKGSLES